MQINYDEIREWIENKIPDMTEDLKRICRIRSFAETEHTDCPPYGQGCIDVLNEMLSIGKENGFKTHNYDNYVGSITYEGETAENIGIWSHLDVVDEGTGWDYPPYEPTLKENYFIARGCQDNKSSAIIGLYVLKYLKEHSIVPKRTVELYLGTCEEQGMYDIDYFLKHYKAPALSLVPDSGFPVCCGERGSFNGELSRDIKENNKFPKTNTLKNESEILEINCNCGIYTVPERVDLKIRYSKEAWEKCSEPSNDILTECDAKEGVISITAKGISTQASFPSKGKSALSLLASFICDRELLNDIERSVFAFVRDINSDHAGTALNVNCEDELSGKITLVATRVRLNDNKLIIDFVSKYPVTLNDFPFEKNTSETALKRGFTFTTTKLSKANYFDPDRSEVKILTEISNEVLGRNDKPFIMSGGTYARKLLNAFAFGTGMPLPPAPLGLFRPGHGDYHQPDESISLLRIQKGLEIYIRSILAIA